MKNVIAGYVPTYTGISLVWSLKKIQRLKDNCVSAVTRNEEILVI